MIDLALVLQIAAVILAAATAFTFDRLTESRGLLPPGFGEPWRRGLAAVLLASLFWIGVFAPVASIGQAPPPDLDQLSASGLFLLHVLIAAVVLLWFLLGWAGSPAAGWRTLAVQLGLVTRRPQEETAIGVLAGVAGWLGVVTLMMAVVGLFTLFGGQGALPQQAPEVIAWIAGLPWLLRAAVSLSAGLVEEVFFRGLLQPRVGIGLSTFLFVLAHASYEQPFMLVGLTFLSLFLAHLVRWRQTIWSAVVAHAVFDLVQLLVVIPLVLDFVPVAGSEEGMAAAVASLVGGLPR